MSKRPRILIVDDEQNIRRILEMAFEKSGYQATAVESGIAALKAIASQEFDVVLSDVTMPGMSGYDLLGAVKDQKPELPFIIMTAYGTIPQAVAAIRNGAHEFVTKPFDLEQLKKIVAAALGPTSKKASRGKGAASQNQDQPFVAVSPAMKEILELVRQVADSKATVMIGGESGVGKEVIARALHALSGRSKQPFVAVSCAALPETLLESELFGYEKGAFTGANGSKIGRFEAADSGTLFLDEIGDIPPIVQVKLLRVLQERQIERLGSNRSTPVDVRVITATHRDLNEAVNQGTFRLDLLYRLQVVEIKIPALRDRQEDIEPLANLFLSKFAAESGREPLRMGPAALDLLLRYRWPGNIRELENTMERASVLAPATCIELEPALLPAPMRTAA